MTNKFIDLEYTAAETKTPLLVNPTPSSSMLENTFPLFEALKLQKNIFTPLARKVLKEQLTQNNQADLMLELVDWFVLNVRGAPYKLVEAHTFFLGSISEIRNGRDLLDTEVIHATDLQILRLATHNLNKGLFQYETSLLNKMFGITKGSASYFLYRSINNGQMFSNFLEELQELYNQGK